MQQPKICLIGNNLSTGGADKIHAVLSNFFHQNGIEVHNVIFIDCVSYSFSGELLNLGKLKSNNNIFDLARRFFILKKYLEQNHFDYIIDFRTRNHQLREFLLIKWLYKVPYIITVHSYKTDWYFPKNKFLASKIFSDAYGIVAVSDQIENKIRSKYHYQNVSTICNPLELESIVKQAAEKISFEFEFVLGAGRMVEDNNKQFDKMIEAYAGSVLPERGIRLVLLGDGPQKPVLEALVKQKKLTGKVIFEGFQENPFKYMRKALFALLTSRYEGLPNIVSESLACGTPVIAFDCKSGPRELISDRQNGLLVDNQDMEKLVLAINEMTENTVLYQNCKANAAESVQRFALDKIGGEWLDFLKIKNN
jgi:N-acetylgalactosamine-N,N'-diacetylbacillosaminyl-diphospho-undecaprenol 4-alpha-N-acetylgalactosaminyltransferase